MKSESAIVLWFTGLSGSGKTTISITLKKILEGMGKKINIFDGDKVREELHTHLGFSREDIRENNKLLAQLSKKNIKNYDFILVPIISPYRNDRKMAKKIIGEKNFIELFIDVSIEECISRDPKGLYKKAMKGNIDNFIGLAKSSPYEHPKNADLIINTVNVSPNESVDQIINFLLGNKYI